MFLTKFQDIWPFGSREKVKKRSRWPPQWPSRISDQNNFRYFDLQVTAMLPTKFQVIWPFFSGEEMKNRFSRWAPWLPSWISDRNDFSYF